MIKKVVLLGTFLFSLCSATMWAGSFGDSFGGSFLGSTTSNLLLEGTRRRGGGTDSSVHRRIDRLEDAFRRLEDFAKERVTKLEGEVKDLRRQIKTGRGRGWFAR